MDILEVSRHQFRNVNSMSCRVISVSDPYFDLFLDSCFSIFRLLSSEDQTQRVLRFRLAAFYNQMSSYISSDFDSDEIEEFIGVNFKSILRELSRYESLDLYVNSMEGAISKLSERGTNAKRQVLKEFLENLESDLSVGCLWRGHKWRNYDIDNSFLNFGASLPLTFETWDGRCLDQLVVISAISKLAKPIMEDIVYRGITSKITAILYSKEKLYFPAIENFILADSHKSEPIVCLSDPVVEPLFPFKQIIELSSQDEPELFVENSGSDITTVDLYLASEDEVRLDRYEDVWVSDGEELRHCLAADIIEGMSVLLKPDASVGPAEDFLDRSEVWRTPLRYLVNIGIPLKDIASGISHRSGVNVSAQMIRGWTDGTVYGPDDEIVFRHLVEELVIRGELARERIENSFSDWWKDLIEVRVDQTQLGMTTREKMLVEARESLQNGIVAHSFEFAEVVVVSNGYASFDARSNFGKLSRRNMRVF